MFNKAKRKFYQKKKKQKKKKNKERKRKKKKELSRYKLQHTYININF